MSIIRSQNTGIVDPPLAGIAGPTAMFVPGKGDGRLMYATVADLCEYIRNSPLDFQSPTEQYLFYSGACDMNVPEAARNGYVDLPGTPGGRILMTHMEKMMISPDSARLLWEEASRTFAAAAKGDVLCRLNGVDPASIFVRIELPTLLENKRISRINGISLEDCRKAHDRGLWTLLDWFSGASH